MAHCGFNGVVKHFFGHWTRFLKIIYTPDLLPRMPPACFEMKYKNIAVYLNGKITRLERTLTLVLVQMMLILTTLKVSMRVRRLNFPPSTMSLTRPRRRMMQKKNLREASAIWQKICQAMSMTHSRTSSSAPRRKFSIHEN